MTEMTTSSTKIPLPPSIFHKDWNFDELYAYYARKEDIERRYYEMMNSRRYDVNAQKYPRFRTIAFWDPNWLHSMPEWKKLVYLDYGNLQKSGEMGWNLWLDADQSFFGISRCKLVLVPLGTPGFGNEPCRRRGWTLLASTRKDKWFEMVGPFSLEESLLEYLQKSYGDDVDDVENDKEDIKNLVLTLRSIDQGIQRRYPA